MRKQYEGNGRIGRFTIGGKELSGALSISGRDTNLYVYSDQFFRPDNNPDRCITGILHDLHRVTLIDCIGSPVSGSRSNSQKEHHEFADIFPHYVLEGDRHINPKEKVIREIRFVIDDASALFYDHGVFSSVIHAESVIQEVATANWKRLSPKYPHVKPPMIGEYPSVLYYTGKSEVLTADTALGKVAIHHSPSTSLGGPDGIYLKNTIVTAIRFEEPVEFYEAMDRLCVLACYFGILVGRPQKIKNIEVCLDGTGSHLTRLQVHWSMPLDRDGDKDGRDPQPIDVLVNGGMDSSAFSAVMVKYLERSANWRDARFRFFNRFSEQNFYSIDRLIADANMFDILPAESTPPSVTLSAGLIAASAEARKSFGALPHGPERDSILSALGRLGRPNLKSKIRYRASLLPQELTARLPNLDAVIDQAVNCRNYYVHGGDPAFDYAKNTTITNFFTSTLEFVFGASDLVEAGWNVGH